MSAGAAVMVRLMETHHLEDQMAALAWLRKATFVQLDRIAVAGNSFGGIQTVLGVERASYCAAVNLTGGAQSWNVAPELRTVMKRAVQRSRAPILFIQAENDYDLSPSKVLSAAMKESGKTFEVKIYPPFGDSPEDGHSFAFRGIAVWFDDAFQFLQRHCRR